MDEKRSTKYLDEPSLAFGHGQVLEHPKDGLMLFGPLEDKPGPAEIRVGVIGRKAGLERYRRWTSAIRSYISAARTEAVHQAAYPGFETIFGCRWPDLPICETEIQEDAIRECLYLSDRHEAIYKTVGLFEKAIRRYLREEEAHVDLWFVVIPEEIYQLGRPKSVVPLELQITSSLNVSEKWVRRLQQEPSFIPEHKEAAEIYKHDVHFHNQLKARLLSSKAALQVVRETSLTPDDFTVNGRPLRKLQDPATVAWNLTTTSFFKASGRPWKLSDVRRRGMLRGHCFQKRHDLSLGRECLLWCPDVSGLWRWFSFQGSSRAMVFRDNQGISPYR
jgi:hypothetical protein